MSYKPNAASVNLTLESFTRGMNKLRELMHTYPDPDEYAAICPACRSMVQYKALHLHPLACQAPQPKPPEDQL